MDSRFGNPTVYLTLTAWKTVNLLELQQMLEKHYALDWGYAAAEICADNDQAIEAGGLVNSVFYTSSVGRQKIMVTTDLAAARTFVRLTDEN